MDDLDQPVNNPCRVEQMINTEQTRPRAGATAAIASAACQRVRGLLLQMPSMTRTPATD
jgi:hypothetical protein